MSDCGNVKKVFVPSKPSKKKKAEKATKPIKGIEISAIAEEKIKTFIENDGKSPKKVGLRIQVVKDGCSGLSYVMDLVEIKIGKEEGDKNLMWKTKRRSCCYQKGVLGITGQLQENPKNGMVLNF